MNSVTSPISKAMMNKLLRTSITALLAAFALILVSCGGGEQGAAEVAGDPVAGEWVVVHELSDPEGLNPIVTNDASASAIFNLVYERLLDQNFVTTELQPVLAESRPVISEDHLRYTFVLKKDIHFSDGSPITTADVLFSFKAVKNPLIIDAAPLRNYYIDVKDIEVTDDRTFTIIMSQPYFLAEWQLGSLWIMSKKHLDPKNLSDGFTIAETNDIDRVEKNAGMKAFASWYNSAEVKRDPKINIGSGPYVFDEWNTGEAVIITRNKQWWNTNTDKYNPAYPGKIIYKVVNDRNTAVVALKNQEIDFMEYVPPPKYTEEIDTTTMTHLAKYAYEGQVYTYIGWNTNRAALSDKRTRKALSHLVDRDALIKQVVRGIAEPLNSPVYPQAKDYDKSIPAIPYDQAKARALLADAGWTDSNNDGILDRMVDGKRLDFTFKFLLNAGNESREQIMLILADEFKRVGIKVEIQKLEWSVFLENLRTRNFDAFVGSWVNDPIPTDPYQLWHSSQTMNNGSNYTGFSNARADKLIELNRTEFDEAKRIEYMKEFQRIVVDEQPYTFLWMPLYPSVYNKRLQNVNYSLVRPGYNPSQWWVTKSQWRLAAAP